MSRRTAVAAQTPAFCAPIPVLRAEGHVVNRKKTQRLYREEGLPARKRKGRKRATGARAAVPDTSISGRRVARLGKLLSYELMTLMEKAGVRLAATLNAALFR